MWRAIHDGRSPSSQRQVATLQRTELLSPPSQSSGPSLTPSLASTRSPSKRLPGLGVTPGIIAIQSANNLTEQRVCSSCHDIVFRIATGATETPFACRLPSPTSPDSERHAKLTKDRTTTCEVPVFLVGQDQTLNSPQRDASKSDRTAREIYGLTARSDESGNWA